MNERRVDGELLIFVFAGRIFSAIAGAVLKHWEEKLQVPLDRLAKEYSDKVVFDVLADLDVPTQNDKVVRGKLDTVVGCSGKYGIIWGSVSVILDLSFSVIRLVAEFGVLATIIGGQRDEVALTLVHLGQEVAKLLLMPGWIFLHTCG